MVAGGASDGASRGLTHFHTWGLVIPLLCAISPMWISKYAIAGVPAPFNAVIFGVIVGALAYAAMQFPPFTEKHALSKAVLCGLLVAEVLTLEAAWGKGNLPPMASITLWLFFYFHTVESSH